MRRYKLDIRGKEFSIDVQQLSADQFEVVVGDESYEVTLASDEELPKATITPGFAPTGAQAQLPRDEASAAGAAPPAPAPKPRAVTVVPKPKKQSGGGSSLNAPMPGVIIAVAVEAGDKVSRGQEVAVLDAMKMHNSIKSPRDGVIREVCVTPGQAVGHGDAIVYYEES